MDLVQIRFSGAIKHRGRRPPGLCGESATRAGIADKVAALRGPRRSPTLGSSGGFMSGALNGAGARRARQPGQFWKFGVKKPGADESDLRPCKLCKCELPHLHTHTL